MTRRVLATAVTLLVTLVLLGTTEVKEPVAAGIGLQAVPTERGDVVVLAVLKGSPAQEKGLKPGDLILQVDGYRLVGTDFLTITSSLLRGPVGSQVTLTYQRPGVYGTFNVTLERRTLITAPVDLPGVKMHPGE